MHAPLTAPLYTCCSNLWLSAQCMTLSATAGLLMDGSHSNPDINLQQERIYAENISAVLHKHKVRPVGHTGHKQKTTPHALACLMACLVCTLCMYSLS